jgi:hypothetical protein
MQTIANFPDLASARVAQAALADEGIESFVPDENLAGIDWTLSTAIGGVRLQVAPDDANAARGLVQDLLQQPTVSEADLDVEEPELYEETGKDGCPVCRSEEVLPARFRKRLKAATMLFWPLLLLWPLLAMLGPRYRCGTCTNQWR